MIPGPPSPRPDGPNVPGVEAVSVDPVGGGAVEGPNTGDRARDVVNSSGPGRWMRFLDALAGLLAAGGLVVGIILLFAALIAPAAVAAAGLGVADGPGWDRVLAQLAVGVAGETVVLLRRRWSTVIRVLADSAVVVAALLVIWWAWLA